MFKPYNKAELHFDLENQIGPNGQNSETFLAKDHQLDAEIVIKRIKKSKLASPQNFFDESKALYASAHPNVVPIHYACFDDEHVFLAMPYYGKGALSGMLANQHLTVREAIIMGCQILSALHNIHSKGLIHFDVKPDNILLSDRGEALLSDFGLAKQMNISGVALQDRLYFKMIAPEAIVGDQFTRAFDIYQFGLTLYRMCNGEASFAAQYAAYGTGNNFRRDDFRFDLRNGRFPDRQRFSQHVPVAMRRIIQKCLETDPAVRFQSAIDVANALADIDGDCLDWRLEEKPEGRVWTKNTNGTKYEFILRPDDSTECFKSVAGGQARRVGDGCKASMSDTQIRTFLGST